MYFIGLMRLFLFYFIVFFLFHVYVYFIFGAETPLNLHIYYRFLKKCDNWKNNVSYNTRKKSKFCIPSVWWLSHMYIHIKCNLITCFCLISLKYVCHSISNSTLTKKKTEEKKWNNNLCYRNMSNFSFTRLLCLLCNMNWINMCCVECLAFFYIYDLYNFEKIK